MVVVVHTRRLIPGIDHSVGAGLGDRDEGNTITGDGHFAARRTKDEASNETQNVPGRWCPHFPLIFLRP